MSDWSTDKIVGAGLVVIALVSVVGAVIVNILTGAETSVVQCAKDISLGLAGFMGREGLEKIGHRKGDKPPTFEGSDYNADK